MRVDFDDIKLNIAKKTYPLIGSGSGRLVFNMENGYVIKMAKNVKGIAQNKAEHQIAGMNHSHLFAKIITASADFTFLIMEKAEKIDNFLCIWSYFNVKNNRELFQIKEFNELRTKYNLILTDLYRHSSWGMIRGKPVIIDFGFTREVKKYYSFFN